MKWFGNLSYSIRRQYVDEFFARQVATLPVGSRLLDVGGTGIKKRGKFDISQYPFSVVCLNLFADKQPTVQADAFFLPFAQNQFDVVICGELLEHVPTPQGVLAEIYRVLQPGGQLLATTPFLYPIHADPFDYGRYTDFFWQKTLAETGFCNIQIEKQGTYHTVLLMYRKLYWNKICKRPLRWLVQPVMQLWEESLYWYEKRLFVQNNPFLSSYTTGFGIVATK